MKKIIYSLATLAFIAVFASCNKDDHQGTTNLESDIESRALSLDYPDAVSYADSVAVQHASGIHLNCDTLANGKHTVCTHVEHSGSKHDGTHHSGTAHSNKSHNNSGHH